MLPALERDNGIVSISARCKDGENAAMTVAGISSAKNVAVLRGMDDEMLIFHTSKISSILFDPVRRSYAIMVLLINRVVPQTIGYIPFREDQDDKESHQIVLTMFMTLRTTVRTGFEVAHVG